MKVSADVRVTAFVRKLRLGDRFTDGTGEWEVVRSPEVVNGSSVVVYVLPFPHHDGQRARAYRYEMDARVDIVR